MKKKLLFLTLGLLAFAKVQSISAQCTITQNTHDFDYAVGSMTQLGQTFSACTGVLRSVQFKSATAFSGNTVTVKIVQKSNCATATTPSNTKGTATFSSASAGVNTVNFSPSISLTAGTYYLEFTSASNNNTLKNFLGIDAGTTYTGGKAFYTSDLGTCRDDDDDIYFVIDMNGTLPVELTQFDATTEGSKTQLTWSTASEKNNEGFEIERSADGAKFEKIGFVKGNGTSNETKQYTYEDNRLSSAVTYYRLKQVDFDGTFTYSKVVSVTGEGGTKLKAYPNPVATVLMLETALKGNYEVINLLGQTVLRGQATAQTIDVSALPQGNYILKVGSEQVKFFKQ